MARHALAEPVADLTPDGIAGVLCGAHAQLLGAAELSIGRRITGATRADVRRALWEERTLVKTFGPRGTIHLLPAADLAMWTGALSALPPITHHPDPVRFSPGQAEEVMAAIGDSLADAELTVDELTESLEARTGPWAVERTMEAFGGKWPRWRQLTGAAAHRGMLCFGPDRGRNVTYTNPHRWLPGFRPADGDAALSALLTRYLHAYGPATPANFAQWLAMPVRRATELFGLVGGELERVELDGTPAWTLTRRTRDAARATSGDPPAALLRRVRRRGPAPESAVPGRGHGRALTPAGQAGNYPVLLVDGVVGGVWHQRRSGRTIAITVEPLRELTAPQHRQLDEEAGLVGAVMGAAVTLTVGTVTVGAHA